MKLLFLLATILVVTLAQKCPGAADDIDLSDSVDSNMAKRRTPEEFKENPMAMLKEDNCAEPEHPNDKPILTTASAKLTKQDIASVKPAIFWHTTCEPCAPKVLFLAQFSKYCAVYRYKEQQVRYVKCPKKCSEPCKCGGSYCQRTDWAKIWFLSYCWGPATVLPGGFTPGWNYRYLWLPQDCTCRTV